MRVIAGCARSLPLKTPEGMDTRPTLDKIKETLFNILQGDIPGCVFVDGFAGSGGIGIEALSRGASKAYFFDSAKAPIDCIQANLAFTKLSGRAMVNRCDIASGLSAISAQYREPHVDLVFLDPPYGRGLERRALEVLRGQPYCDGQTLIVIEAQLREDFSWTEELGFAVKREKKYKTNQHIFLQRC